MGVLNDTLWSICGKEEGMAIRGNYAREVDPTHYSPNHIKSIIKSIGLEVVGETSNDFLCYCPFHSNRHTSSFSVSREKGAFICFNPSCGEAGTLLELVKRTMSKNDFEAMRFISSKEAEALENFDELLSEAMEEKPVFEQFPEDTLFKLYNEMIATKEGVDYFKTRGINKDSVDHFKLGYSKNMGMVTVPVHSPDGTAIGIVGRSIEGKSFKNSTNLPKSKTLFNIHRAKKIGDHVIIVESSFDAIRVHQAGFPNVVATLGGFLSKEQQHLLNRYFNRITIMTDADLAGRELGLSVANKLRTKDILWASYSYGKIYPHDAKDVGDMTDEEIIHCIKNAVSDIEYRTWNK
jgi:DNA primase